jgi:hypothetical protein
MRMKVHRHELEDMAVLLDAAPEFFTTFVGSEGDGGDRTARIVNRHREAAADPELRRLVEKSALWLREPRRGKFLSPLEETLRAVAFVPPSNLVLSKSLCSGKFLPILRFYIVIRRVCAMRLLHTAGRRCSLASSLLNSAFGSPGFHAVRSAV